MTWGFVPLGKYSSPGYLHLLGLFLLRAEVSPGDKCGAERVAVTLPETRAQLSEL